MVLLHVLLSLYLSLFIIIMHKIVLYQQQLLYITMNGHSSKKFYDSQLVTLDIKIHIFFSFLNLFVDYF